VSQQRRYNPALLPIRYAKYLMIDWATEWFTTNGIFQVDGNAGGPVAPPPLDADGTPGKRPTLASMFIRDEYGENPEVDRTTGIVVSRGRIGFKYQGIGQVKGPVMQPRPTQPRREGDATKDKGNWEQGTEFTDVVNIPLTMFCLSKEGLEAEEIATNVVFGLHFMRLILPQRYACLRDIVGLSLEEERPVRQSTTRQELVAVPVAVTLELQYFWQVYERGDLPMRFVNFGVQNQSATQSGG